VEPASVQGGARGACAGGVAAWWLGADPHGSSEAARGGPGGGSAPAKEAVAQACGGCGSAVQVRREAEDRRPAQLDPAGARVRVSRPRAGRLGAQWCGERSGSGAQGLRPGAAALQVAALACRPCFSSTRA
jgi:hypothetical protein